MGEALKEPGPEGVRRRVAPGGTIVWRSRQWRNKRERAWEDAEEALRERLARRLRLDPASML